MSEDLPRHVDFDNPVREDRVIFIKKKKRYVNVSLIVFIFYLFL